MKQNFHLGLLYLIHLLVGVDGKIHETETEALNKIKFNEAIDDQVLSEFDKTIQNSSEREVYKKGIDLINQCSREEKLKTFVALYKMSEVDGRVHIKEIRLLLYSIEMAGIEFDDVVNAAKNFNGFS
jgi:uncharacterized tellurite resistance protein B-like protein